MKTKKKTKQNPENLICAACLRQLVLGSDVLSVDEGVIGPRGLVPLGQTKFFCCESCLQDFVVDDGNGLISLPPRIPD